MNKLTKNGGSSLLLDDEFTFPFFCWIRPRPIQNLPVLLSQKKSIGLMDKQYFFQPMVDLKFLKKENGKFNLDTLLVSERYLVIAR